MTEIRIKFHENYVQTVVRIGKPSGVEYVDYAVGGVLKPREILFTKDEEELVALLRTWDSSGESVDVEQCRLAGFDGYAEIRIVFPDRNDHTQFVVTDAGLYRLRSQAKILKNSLQDPQMKRPIMKNLLDALAEKNVQRLIAILNALATK